MVSDAVDVDEAEPVAEGELSKIRAIAQRQLEAAALVETKNAELKAAAETLRAIAEKELPDAMAAIGLRDFSLDSGHRVALVVSHHCGLTEARKPAAFAWLKENGLDDIIEREISIYFGRGEADLADNVGNQIKELAPENKFSDTASIHAGTLKAFVKERLANNEPLPLDIFGVFTKNIAEIEEPNEKKEKVRKNAPAPNQEF